VLGPEAALEDGDGPRRVGGPSPASTRRGRPINARSPCPWRPTAPMTARCCCASPSMPSRWWRRAAG